MGASPDALDVLPVLPSLNISETRDFYGAKLGLEEVVYEDPSYLILRRPGIELHFWLTDNRTLCENTSVYIRGGSIDQLHSEFSRRGAERLSEMAVRAWDMEEFYVHDPHGNLLRFGRAPVVSG